MKMIFKIARIVLLVGLLTSALFFGCSVDNGLDAQLRERYEYSIEIIRRSMVAIEPSIQQSMVSILYSDLNRNLSYNSLHFKGLSSALFDPNIGLTLFGISPVSNYSKIIIYRLDEASNVVEGFDKVIDINEQVIRHPDQLSRPELIYFRLYFTLNDFPEIVEFIEASKDKLSVAIVFDNNRIGNRVPLTIKCYCP